MQTGLTRSTILALTALLGHASLLAQNTNVYSLNASGYINVTCQPGYNLIACPLVGYPNNDPVYLLGNSNGFYNGCQIFFWQNGTWTKYIANNNPTPPATATNGWVEPDGPMALSPGAGAVFYNPSTVLTITFVGTIPTGGLTNTLNPGFNLVSSILPAAGDLSTNSLLSFPSLAAGQFDGDQLFLYFNSGNGSSGYTMFTVDSLSYNPPLNYGWDGFPGQSDATIPNVGQAFWYRAGHGVIQWTESYSLDADSRSDHARSIISVSPSGASRRFDANTSAKISKSGHFHFTLNGQEGVSHVVEASSDLKSWQPVETNFSSSGKSIFTDLLPATNKMRFYRSFALP